MTKPEKIRCDACPVMCYIAEGKVGACDRYANEGGRMVVTVEGTEYGRCADTITEFPLFTLWLGDLHPHLLSMPLAVLVVLVAVVAGALLAVSPWHVMIGRWGWNALLPPLWPCARGRGGRRGRCCGRVRGRARHRSR